ncbi:MAG: hypothetical protein ABJT22_04845 [Parasphingorhabdus sp.]|uniref:hypothetical protein n=1 Tax=Parasphingorhabdus sp. TaxID=2709688 RepID=UPI003296AF7F
MLNVAHLVCVIIDWVELLWLLYPIAFGAPYSVILERCVVDVQHSGLNRAACDADNDADNGVGSFNPSFNRFRADTKKPEKSISTLPWLTDYQIDRLSPPQ